MESITTVTQKGQVTIPVKMRKRMGIKLRSKVMLKLDRAGKIKITPVITISDLAGKLVPRANKNIDPVKARELMEKYYLKYDKTLLERI